MQLLSHAVLNEINEVMQCLHFDCPPHTHTPYPLKKDQRAHAPNKSRLGKSQEKQKRLNSRMKKQAASAEPGRTCHDTKRTTRAAWA